MDGKLDPPEEELLEFPRGRPGHARLALRLGDGLLLADEAEVRRLIDAVTSGGAASDLALGAVTADQPEALRHLIHDTIVEATLLPNLGAHLRSVLERLAGVEKAAAPAEEEEEY